MKGSSFKKLLNNVKKELRVGISRGITIVVVGIISLFTIQLVPSELRFFVTLLYFSSFAGILYLFYSPSFAAKKILLALFSMFIIALAIQSGVFTVIVYMGITLFSFFFLGKKYALWKKIIVFVVGVFMLFITQNVKTSFRDVTWKGKEVDSKTGLLLTSLSTN